jgi:hypothetical protein
VFNERKFEAITRLNGPDRLPRANGPSVDNRDGPDPAAPGGEGDGDGDKRRRAQSMPQWRWKRRGGRGGCGDIKIQRCRTSTGS